MLQYILRRILLMIPTVIAISMVVFFIIQLPPGDFLDTLVSGLSSQGGTVNQEAIEALKEQYGLGQPIYVQYWKWVSGIVMRGDFGRSFEYNQPVSALVWDRLGFSIALSIAALLLTWVIAFPIGVWSAARQYTISDYFFTFIGFIGLAIPEFLMALVLLYVSFKYFGQSVGGFFSPEYIDASWSGAKFLDFLGHVWIPIVIIAVSGTAGLIRITRANLLDELNKPYVVTGRAKGLTERRLLLKYPVRVALNPFVSTIGYTLPAIIGGEAVIAVVLNLPTTGPLLLHALQSQDMYLAGTLILFVSILTVIGTLISDLLLVWLDPRIRYQ
jgi:peptide/nickel transport system permease protein